MTIGWIEQFIDEGKLVDGFPQTRGVKRQRSENSDESPESEEDRSPSPGLKRRRAKEE